MRVLPRSTKGTWLLAAAAWLAMCALGWLFTPVRPRLAWTEPLARVLIEAGPNGRTLLVASAGSRDDAPEAPVYLFDLVDHRMREVPDFPDLLMQPISGMAPIHVFSPDGRWLFVPAKDQSKAPFRLIDILDGSETRIALNIGDELAGCGRAIFSPDGNWLAFQIDGEKTNAVRLWDLRNKRPGPELPGAANSMAFSANGKRLATEVFSSDPREGWSFPNGFAIWEVTTGRKIAEASKTLDNWVWNVEAITPDGDALIVSRKEGTGISGVWIGPEPRELALWDFAERRIRWSIHEVGYLEFSADMKQAVLSRRDRERRWDFEEVVTIDLATGEVKNCVPFSADVILGIAPHGRSYLFNYHESDLWGTVRDWLEKRGLNWIKGGDTEIKVVERSTGRGLLSLPSGRCKFTPDGDSLVHLGSAGAISVWDIPPHKPLGWFGLAAAGLALPIAWFARRRVRHLRRETA